MTQPLFWQVVMFLGGLALNVWFYISVVNENKEADKRRVKQDESVAKKQFEQHGKMKYLLKGMVLEYAEKHDIPINGELDDYFGDN